MLQDYSFLYGQWKVVYTNFPMWLKGDKLNPRLNYAPTDKPNIILDVVKYKQSGNIKQIKGTDYSKGNSEFIWRGQGLLRLL